MVRKKNHHLPLDQISKKLCRILKEVYNDDSRNSYKKGVKELYDFYEAERSLDINKDELLLDLTYRAKMFLSGLTDADGQFRLFKALATFSGKVLMYLEDDSAIEALTLAIHEKKYESFNARCNVATLIGKIFAATMKNPEDDEENDTECFPSYLTQERFTDLYRILITLSSNVEKEVRMVVILSLKNICKYDKLMEFCDIESFYYARHLILVGTKDPDEIVRETSIKYLPITTESHGLFILECLLNESSDIVKKAAARRVIEELPYDRFKKQDLWVFFKSKQLFLNDEIIPEYFDILVSWSDEAYKKFHNITGPLKLTPDQTCEGSLHFLASIMYGKEWHQVYRRYFEHLRKKFFPEEEDGEDTYLEFIKLFCDSEDEIFINSTNYMEFTTLDFENNSLIVLNMKLRKAFMWLMLCEYCLHNSVNEVSRIECRSKLLPTMVDYIDFMTKAIDCIKREGDSIVYEGKKHKDKKVISLQSAIIKCLLKIIPYMEKDDIGMNNWKHLLINLLTDPTIGIQIDQDMYLLIVYQLIFYHFNVKDPISMDRAVHEISDICYQIIGTGQIMNSQDLFNGSQMTNATQYSMSFLNDSQQTTTLLPREEPPIEMTPEQMSRCVNILAAVIKTGFFMKQNTVFDGLILNFGIRSFDTAIDLETMRLGFFCIAGMATITDQNERNYIRYARAILDNENGTIDIKKIALMMLNDCIQMYGYDRVVELYFQDMHGEVGVTKYNLVNKLIEIAEDDTAKSLSTFVIRIMLRLIVFDYNKTFKECFMYLLKKLFRKTMDDIDTTTILFNFFISYVSVSREHQVIFIKSSVDALTSLMNCDLESLDAKIDKNLLADYILALTSYNMLRIDGINKNEGTSHILLARQLILKIDELDEKDDYTELLGRMISQCEVTEISDNGLISNLKIACKKLVNNVSFAKLKRYIETYYKRIESYEKYITTKKVKITDEEQFRKLNQQELEKELQTMINEIKFMDEETNNDKVSWINNDSKEVNNENDNTPKIKIWGEKTYDLKQMLAQLIVQTSSPTIIPKSTSRRPTRTPKTPVLQKKTVQSTPKRPPKLLTKKHKPLPTVHEDDSLDTE